MKAIKKLISTLEETTPENFTLERRELLLKQAEEVRCYMKLLGKMVDIKILRELQEKSKKDLKKK